MRSVSTAFEVLDALAERQPVGVGDLARALELPKSTVQRCLAVLADSGWIRPWGSDGHTKWVLTVKPLTLAGYVMRDANLLREAAVPVMAELGRRTTETVHLTVPDGDGMVLVHKVDSTHAVRTVSWIGGRVAIHASASGIAILAHLPPEQIDAIELTRHTDTTLTERQDLADALAETRERGYTVNIGMWRDDVSAVAAAILDPAGRPIASVSISVPTYRFADDHRAEFGTLVHTAAEKIAASLFGAA
jgi:IclR family acetate operon transcriptional repressor